MSRPRMGQVLGWMGQLSDIDVQEILAEQAVTRERFGQIALSLGLCEPQHIWSAWCSQLAIGTERVALVDVGIDAGAVGCLPAELARGMEVIPIRHVEDKMIIATARLLDSGSIAELMRTSGMQIRFVFADASEIHHAIETYYDCDALAHAAA